MLVSMDGVLSKYPYGKKGKDVSPMSPGTHIMP